MIDIRKEVRFIKIVTPIWLVTMLIFLVVCPKLIIWPGTLIAIFYIAWLSDKKVWLLDKKIWLGYLGYDKKETPKAGEVWEIILVDCGSFFKNKNKGEKYERVPGVQKSKSHE